MTDWASRYHSGSSSGGGGGTDWASRYNSGGGGSSSSSGGGGLFDWIGREVEHVPGVHAVESGFHQAGYGLGQFGSQAANAFHAIPSIPGQIIHTLGPHGVTANLGTPFDKYLPFYHPHQKPDLNNLIQGTFRGVSADVAGLKNPHYVATHPLNYLLDAASVATLGGTGGLRIAARGALGERLGTLATSSRVIQDADKVVQLAQSGTLHGRAFQRALDRFSQSHAETPYIGVQSRVNRVERTRSYYRTQAELKIVRQLEKEGKPLSKQERLAVHIAAEPLGLGDRISLYQRLNAEKPSASIRKYLKQIQDPKVAEALVNPRPELVTAVNRVREIEQKETEAYQGAGVLAPETHEARVQLPADIAENYGIKPNPARPDVSPALGDPFRFPHMGSEQRPSVFSTPLGGLSAVRKPGFLKRSRAALFTRAQLITDPVAVYGQSFMSSMRYLHSVDLQNELYDPVARRLVEKAGHVGGKPVDGVYYWSQKAQDRYLARQRGASRPARQREMREMRGAPTRYADIEGAPLDEPGRQRIADDAYKAIFAEGDRPNFPNFHTRPDEAEAATIRRMDAAGIKWIPKQYAEAYKREFVRTNAFMRNLVDRPTDWWRALTLKYRPAWAVNNIVGQHILFAMNATPGAPATYLQALALRAKGQTIDDLPGLRQGFAHTQSAVRRPGFAKPLVDRSVAAHAARAVGVPFRVIATPIKKVGDGLLAINELGEQIPRDAAFLQEAEPILRAIQKHAKQIEGVNLSLVDAVGRLDRRTAELLVDKTNAMMGDFGRLSHVERTALRRIIPFYSWFRTISVVTGKYAARYPARARMIAAMGEIEKGKNALLPSWLRGAIALGAKKAGVQTMLSTAGLNPFETVTQLGGVPGSAVSGKPTFGTENPGGLLNPLLQAGITGLSGRDLFTGGDYQGPGQQHGWLGAAAGQLVSGLPEYRLAETTTGMRPSTLYANTWQDYVANYLGLPIRRVRLREARKRAKEGQ